MTESTGGNGRWRGPRPRPTAHLGRGRSADSVLEVVELAGVRAEEVVAPHRARRSTGWLRGVATVVVDFTDADLLLRFQEAGAIARSAIDPSAPSWDVVRRWEGAGGDALLDEDMGVVVASHLNDAFAGGLRARVFTWIDRQ